MSAGDIRSRYLFPPQCRSARTYSCAVPPQDAACPGRAASGGVNMAAGPAYASVELLSGLHLCTHVHLCTHADPVSAALRALPPPRLRPEWAGRHS